MERKAIKILVDLLQPTIEKARLAAEQNRESANEMSKTANAATYAAGEREYTAQQAKITRENLEELEELGKGVAAAVGRPVPATVQPISLVTVEYNGGETESFYFVSKSVYLNGVKLISPESPIGKAVADKSMGEGFEYEVGTERVRGKIARIE